ncbi:hypothetical protein IV102_22815 [bacterium]|nr:hypothetical protein [bacterium]
MPTLTELGKAAPGMVLDTENDWGKDGCFVGAGGQTFPASTPWHQVPPVLPNNGKAAWRTVIMVNGIMTDVALQASDMQRMANSGYKVVGIHNDTQGMLVDLAQCVGDKLELDMANNHATATTAQVVADLLQADETPLLVGHSQGALVVSNALGRVQDGLIECGVTPEEAARRLEKLQVTTLGGASWTFPEGPKYCHVVNFMDVVPMATGVGVISGLSDTVHLFGQVNAPHHLPQVQDGLGNYLARVVDRSVHGPQDIYIPKLEEIAPTR